MDTGEYTLCDKAEELTVALREADGGALKTAAVLRTAVAINEDGNTSQWIKQHRGGHEASGFRFRFTVSGANSFASSGTISFRIDLVRSRSEDEQQKRRRAEREDNPGAHEAPSQSPMH
nr:hypothetical protein Iba_chr10aCG4480 [Ipomoea batatas]